MPITILVGTHYFPAHGGGVERVAGELVKHLSRKSGVRIVWVASDCDASPPDSQVTQHLRMRSWNGMEKRTGLPFPVWFPHQLPSLWRAVGAADVIHVHDYLYLGNLILVVCGKIRRKPVLVTQHIGFIPYKSRLLRGLLTILNHTLGKLILSTADYTVFVSEPVRRYFMAFTGFKRPPRLINNGLDTTLFRVADGETRNRVRATLGVKTDQLVFLFVGRFVEKKGLGILELLIRSTPQCLWLMVGQGPMEPERWGAVNVKVFRGMQQSALVSIYQSSDLLVLPSKGEGFPLVVQEAMACGTPVMVGEETAEALVTLGGPAMSADAESSDAAKAWQKALATILTKPASLAEMRTVVAAFAHGTWSWEKCAEDYLHVIEGLVRDAATSRQHPPN
ncbi:MAG: glycosyltransferase family 4 protein [Prolixibacteraceae bacterium]|nr:glycosyltransferase family 4 protein [Burkholderiales bacterium]